MSATGLVAPHGGELVDLVVDATRRSELEKLAQNLPRILLPQREQCDLELMAVGALSPLATFLNEADFHGVCDNMRLENGLVWSMPITCSVDKATAERIELGQPVALADDQNRTLAVMTIHEKYAHDKKKEAAKAYLTTDDAHPGVAGVMAQGDVCLHGPLEVLTPRYEPEFAKYRLTPAQTRAAFAERGWQTVVAFQTRNPIHRAHEYITKCALEIVDGLLFHPLVGVTREGDIPADVRMRCYETLLEHYYSPDHTILAVLPAAMRYAGPREAVMHVLMRRNYGLTHFIIGRDHAGVGKYYGAYDSQRIFDQFDPAELGVTPMKFKHCFWCKRTGAMGSAKTTNAMPDERVFLSGTKVREMLSRGERPPPEFTRPEIADILIDSMRSNG